MGKKPIFSIIIPCFNGKKYIGQCLKSIAENTQGETNSIETIVIDDASTDGSREWLRSISQGNKKMPLRVIFNDKNVGPAQSRNIGAKIARGRYFLFLDADTEIEKGIFAAFLTAFQKDAKIGAIQAKLLLGKTGKIDAAGHFLSPFGFPYEIGVKEKNIKHNTTKLIFAGRSAALAIRKDVFDKIGGFDQDYLIYGEDTDLCWRVWLAGYKIIFLPQAKVYHFTKSSLGPKTNYRIFYEGAKNNTANLLKNAPAKKLLWLFPLHLLGWAIISLKLIFQKKWEMAGWVWKGLFWNFINMGKIRHKRKSICQFATADNQAAAIMFGKITIKKLLKKGWRWFKHV